MFVGTKHILNFENNSFSEHLLPQMLRLFQYKYWKSFENSLRTNSKSYNLIISYPFRKNTIYKLY